MAPKVPKLPKMMRNKSKDSLDSVSDISRASTRTSKGTHTRPPSSSLSSLGSHAICARDLVFEDHVVVMSSESTKRQKL